MTQKREYVVIFGAAVTPDGLPSAVLRHRLEAALGWAEGRADVRFLVTGGLGHYPPSEAEAMRDYLLERGVHRQAILMEQEGRNTLSSAALSIGILRTRPDVGSVVLCSSSFHLPRCWLVFRSMGIKARVAEIESDKEVLGLMRWLKASAREVPAILLDLTLGFARRLTGVS